MELSVYMGTTARSCVDSKDRIQNSKLAAPQFGLVDFGADDVSVVATYLTVPSGTIQTLWIVAQIVIPSPLMNSGNSFAFLPR